MGFIQWQVKQLASDPNKYTNWSHLFLLEDVRKHGSIASNNKLFSDKGNLSKLIQEIKEQYKAVYILNKFNDMHIEAD